MLRERVPVLLEPTLRSDPLVAVLIRVGPETVRLLRIELLERDPTSDEVVAD
jgi:hypothetical protein